MHLNNARLQLLSLRKDGFDFGGVQPVAHFLTREAWGRPSPAMAGQEAQRKQGNFLPPTPNPLHPLPS